MWARLIEPDGTENVIVTIAYAEHYCETHPGWEWEMIDQGEIIPDIESEY